MPQPSSAPAISARLIAAQLVSGVLVDRRMLSDAQVDQAPDIRATALRLAAQTLRNLARCDHVLRPHLRKEPPPLVQAALRVGVLDMLANDAPAHGVVNDLVGALRTSRKTAPMAGLVNAVLRKASGFAGFHDLPVQPLPGWLARRLRPTLGDAGIEGVQQAHHAGAPLDLTLRAGHVAPPGAQRLPNGSARLSAAGQVSALPGYDSGDWWVQDAAASLPAMLLAVEPGERVLDLCAAPGGKTMQLADAGGVVTALDVSGPRIKRVHANLARTGLSARVLCDDALTWTPDAPFDAVLLDAPCSATGTIRRHPDLPFVRKPADLDTLIQLQARLLDRALGMLKPGGRMVYCTCSLLPDEGEDQIAAALTRHPDLRAAPVSLPLGQPAPQGWRTRPDAIEGGMDGFYMALLRRLPG